MVHTEQVMIYCGKVAEVLGKDPKAIKTTSCHIEMVPALVPA